MDLLAFTPTKFAVLLVASVGITLSTANHPTTTHSPDAASLYTHAADGQANGALTANLYLATDYPQTRRAPDRLATLSAPQSPTPTPRHTSLTLTR